MLAGSSAALLDADDPRGWLQLVNCGHPPALRLSADGELAELSPTAFATPLGLHPDIHPSTFSVRTGDRLLFFTDGLLEARDRAGDFLRVDQQTDALRRPDLQAAADELLDRLRAYPSPARGRPGGAAGRAHPQRSRTPARGVRPAARGRSDGANRMIARGRSSGCGLPAGTARCSPPACATRWTQASTVQREQPG
jgi:Stage II sporulation protein E (SpoIIE)